MENGMIYVVVTLFMLLAKKVNLCANVNCPARSPTCDGNGKNLITYTNNRCENGACKYDESTTECEFACEQGKCIPKVQVELCHIDGRCKTVDVENPETSQTLEIDTTEIQPVRTVRIVSSDNEVDMCRVVFNDKK